MHSPYYTRAAGDNDSHVRIFSLFCYLYFFYFTKSSEFITYGCSKIFMFFSDSDIQHYIVAHDRICCLAHIN
jgi:hypothetical protein